MYKWKNKVFRIPKEPHLGAGILLLNNKFEVLLVRDKISGKWSFPKGHRENNEKPIDTAFREFKEETGVDLKNFSHQIIASRNSGPKDYYRFYGIILKNNDLNEYIDPHPLINSEIEEISWKTIDEIADLDCNFLLKIMKRFLVEVINKYKTILYDQYPVYKNYNKKYNFVNKYKNYLFENFF